MPIDERLRWEGELASALTQVRRVFDTNSFLKQRASNRLTVEYYERARTVYKWLYSRRGAMHLGLTFGRRRFKHEDFLGQAKRVSAQIRELRARRVLELGCGPGFNIEYLARLHPDVAFVGVDITPSHLALVRKRAAGLPNLRALRGDFQQLPLDDDSFDLVYEVEAACHATDLGAMFAQAHRVLRPGGRYCLFDGARRPDYDELDGQVREAAVLVEQSMAITTDPAVNSVAQLIERTGFEVLLDEDLTEAVLPTLRNLRIMSGVFVFSPAVARLMIKLFSREAFQSALAFMLMPSTMRLGAHYYYQQVLQK